MRIVAATQQDLRVLIQQGLFREDLFFRLNVVPIRLPPLRERAEDVPDLVRALPPLAEREGLPPKPIDAAALERLKRYRWPGNVRELENLVRRLCALYPQEMITGAVIDAELIQPAVSAPDDEGRSEDTIGAAIERHLSRYFGNRRRPAAARPLRPHPARDGAAAADRAALSATRGNQVRAAELLGVNRNTLRKKIRDPGYSGDPARSRR